MQTDNPLRILFIGNHLSNRGVSTVSKEIAANLKEKGYITWVTSCQVSPIIRLLEMLRTIWLFRNNYEIAQVDVYSGRAFFWAEATCNLLHLLKKPFIITLHGGNLPLFAQHHPKRVTHLLEIANKITVPSAYLHKQMQIYSSNLVLVPNPLNIDQYPFRLRKLSQPKLVWLRSFHSIYNPALAAQVINLLQEEFPDISLKMVGYDKKDGSLEKFLILADDLNVKNHIEVIGGVKKNEVPFWLDQGDIFLNTTTTDNTPVSVMEAMACGLCIVSTNVGGIPYLLDDNQDALLVESDDPEGMARSIKRILKEPGLAARLSENARQKCEVFDWSQVLPRWEEIFKSILPG